MTCQRGHCDRRRPSLRLPAGGGSSWRAGGPGPRRLGRRPPTAAAAAVTVTVAAAPGPWPWRPGPGPDHGPGHGTMRLPCQWQAPGFGPEILRPRPAAVSDDLMLRLVTTSTSTSTWTRRNFNFKFKLNGGLSFSLISSWHYSYSHQLFQLFLIILIILNYSHDSCTYKLFWLFQSFSINSIHS